MRFILRTGLFLILVISSFFPCLAQKSKAKNDPRPSAIEANTWQEYLAPDGFSILMPGVPTPSTQEADTSFGRVTQRRYTLETQTATYIVLCSDFPTRLDDPQSARMILKVERDNLLALNQNLKLLSERDVKIGHLDGHELLIKDKDSILRSRTFILGSRSYQLTLTVPRKTAFIKGKPTANPSDYTDMYRETANKFFDSFKLVDNDPEAPPIEAISIDNPSPVAVSGGVLNGKAIKLPQPVYPAGAKSAGVEGAVAVEVVIDVEGKVVEAKAISGHPLLRDEAVKAARQALFTPIELDGKPVKTTGLLYYNFAIH